jgi:diguanylate cyclase (GGDEF)-like protein
MRRFALLLALPLLALIAWIDYITGPEIVLSLFYLLPIVTVSWFGGRAQATASAALAAALATVADAPLRHGPYIFAWDAFTRLVLFTALAVLLSRVKRDRDELRSLNTQLQSAYEREATLARTDALTGLANRRAFLEEIHRELARAAREGSHVCVLFLDVDNLKRVNDCYGHPAGDVVIRSTAVAITASVRAGDVAARVGGDEFIVLLWHATKSEAEQIARRIEERVSVLARDYPLARLGVSIGSTLFEHLPATAEELLRLSDAAMYGEKSRKHAVAM